MSELFNQILFLPLFNLLVFFYNTIAFEDVGVAIILLTLLVKLVLSPLSYKAVKSQKELQQLQPKLQEVQIKYKNNKQELGKATMDLYKQHKVNPFSGCLPILIQLPILIALYRISILGFSNGYFDFLYPFIKNPGVIQTTSLGFIEITKRSIPLAILAGIVQYLYGRVSRVTPIAKKTPVNPTGPDIQTIMQKQTLYFFPIFTIIIAWGFPAGLPLYWIANTCFSIVETLVVGRWLLPRSN